MIEKFNPDLIIFPSHYLIPVHYTGIIYQGSDKVYAKQLFGSTHNSYQNNKSNLKENFFKRKINKKRKKELEKEIGLIYHQHQQKINKLFNLDFSNNHLINK